MRQQIGWVVHAIVTLGSCIDCYRPLLYLRSWSFFASFSSLDL